MTLESLERIALANNPTLVQATARIQAARAHRLQEGLYPNPTLGYLAEEIGNEGSRGQQGGFVRQEIVTAGKLRLRRNVAGHEVVEAEHAYQSQRQRVLADVRAAWYEALVAGQIVQLNRQLSDIADKVVKTAGNLFDAQEVGRVDVLQAEIEVGSTQLKLHEAENRLETTRRQLAIFLGVPDMDLSAMTGRLEDDLPPLDWNDSLQRLKEGSPQLAEARSAVERARCAVARENAERTPNFDVRAAVQYDDAVGDSYASVEIGMPLPIFNRNQGNICRAQAQLLGAKKEVERLDLSLQARLATAFGRYRNAQYDADKYAIDILPKAKTSLDLVRSGYR
ncbi:MAG: TolC family protein, partial [Thermoguttaceae bacterium]